MYFIKRRKKRGQISIEYVMLLGMILVVSVSLFSYVSRKASEDIRINQADDTVKTIINTANSVYSLGLGGKSIAIVNIPSGVVSGGVYDKTLVLNLSIFGGVSEFFSSSKARLVATSDFSNKIKIKGTYHVPVETFKDKDGKIKVLLGGFCGDTICSSTENSDNCNLDCTSFCPDLVCDSNEDCTCSDCYGQQDNCPSNQVCDPAGSGSCVQSVQISCGDGKCTGLVGDNCNDCVADCPLVQEHVCCPYDPQKLYYVLWKGTSCPVVPPSVSNCGDYCVYIGAYNNGWCRQTAAQCTKNNEVYQSGGDIWCSGSPTGDSCCCKP